MPQFGIANHLDNSLVKQLSPPRLAAALSLFRVCGPFAEYMQIHILDK
jgi:hypothetical protein